MNLLFHQFPYLFGNLLFSLEHPGVDSLLKRDNIGTAVTLNHNSVQAHQAGTIVAPWINPSR
jgi:hypothetical protein